MPWKRQHAIQIAAQLPPNPTDARMVLDYARDLFLGLHLTIFFGMRNRMNLPNLVTAQEVIAQLGGIKGVRQLTGSDYQRVWNWKAFGRFPARTYVLMSAELRRRGFTATTDLWSFDKRDRPPNQPPKRHRKKGKRQ